MLGYARLLVWTEHFELAPDLLRAVEVEENRRFTLHLRPGHRWSDGQPFTTADFRFWWERVANNPELSPAGLPAELLVDGQPPRFEVLDETRLRLSWDAPNNQFLPALAATRPLSLYRPAHYLRQFHPDFVDRARLEAQAAAQGLAGWAALFEQRDRPFLLANPDYPTLQPWRLTNRAADRALALRSQPLLPPRRRGGPPAPPTSTRSCWTPSARS